MVRSDPTDALRERPRWSLGRIMLVTLLAVVTLIVVWQAAVFLSLRAHFGSGFDDRRFDDLQADFARDRAGFEAVARRMQELVEANPGATRIVLTVGLTCVSDSDRPSQDDDCAKTVAADQTTFRALPAADSVVHQAKDGQRLFFRFFQNDPPLYTIMYAPGDDDPGRFADDRGFRSHRELGPGWTLLGPIPDLTREDQQWMW